MSSKSTAALLQLIELLQPLADEERHRTIRAALTFLGSPAADPAAAPGPAAPAEAGAPGGLPRKAEAWLRQHDLTAADLDGVFHRTAADCQVIAAALPGAGPKEQARQCYLLAGAAALLRTGDPAFADDAARELCRQFGCYDSTNHTKYVRSLGNLAAERAGGWTLTRPGLDAAGELVKRLAAARG